MAIGIYSPNHRGGYQELSASSLSIDIPAVTDFKDVDAAISVLDGINDAIIALPDAIAFLGRKLFTTWRPRIIFERFYTFENALQVFLGNRLQFFDG